MLKLAFFLNFVSREAFEYGGVLTLPMFTLSAVDCVVAQKRVLIKSLQYFRLFIGLVLTTYVAYIVVEVVLVSPQNLVSGLGYIVYVLLFFIFSAAPAKVRALL